MHLTPSSRRVTRCLRCIASLIALGGAIACEAAADSASPHIAHVRVGIANHFKVGHWTPVWVDVESAAALDELRVEVTTVDSDGVQTTTSGPVQSSASPNALPSACVYVMVGRMQAELRVALLAADQQVDVKIVQPGMPNKYNSGVLSLPATSQLAFIMGSKSFDLKNAFADRDAVDGHPARRIVRLDRVWELPTDWIGYEAVDLVILAADDSDLWRELVADGVRHAALLRWIELGGRIVVMCGGENATDLLAEGAPLASLVPGKLDDVVRLPETTPLEHFANSEAPIVARGMRAPITVPKLIDVVGNIDVYAGRRPIDLPIVIRSARGLGEITFVGVDFSKPPLANWSGHTSFFEALLRPYLAQNGPAAGGASQTLVTRGYNDLSGAFRQRLGRSFASVAPIAFPLVTLLAIGYMLFLGPIDYLVVHRLFRRPWLAWVTFPLILLAFGFTALAIADWRIGGSRPRVNRMELVDVDMATGQARGTFWATLYSPHANQFNLSLAVEPPTKTQAAPEIRLSWWGLPGSGIGGMQASRSDAGFIRTGYRFSPTGDALENLPVFTSATKSLLSRWTATIDSPIEVQLADQEGMAAGFVVNRTGHSFKNLRLFYNGWAYLLGNVAPGRRVDVSEENSPRRVKTIVTQTALGAGAAGQDEAVFVAERATALEILNLMMFFRAGGGYGFAGLPNDYLAFCDLSRSLDLGRAILVAEVDSPGSQLIDTATGEPLGDDRDEIAVMYRFVLPVSKGAE